MANTTGEPLVLGKTVVKTFHKLNTDVRWSMSAHSNP
jgi:hypothetical protein